MKFYWVFFTDEIGFPMQTCAIGIMCLKKYDMLTSKSFSFTVRNLVIIED